jgi:hypothetical protein
MLLRPQGLLGSTEWGFLKPEIIRPRLKPEAVAVGSSVDDRQGVK